MLRCVAVCGVCGVSCFGLCFVVLRRVGLVGLVELDWVLFCSPGLWLFCFVTGLVFLCRVSLGWFGWGYVGFGPVCICWVGFVFLGWVRCSVSSWLPR